MVKRLNDKQYDKKLNSKRGLYSKEVKLWEDYIIRKRHDKKIDYIIRRLKTW